ncbi:uncharacterized protein LOC114448079 [Parambassis ranga]|uniref:Uncharacterized protein LOC114448079 n=1 Tax=Parambassis ranga TaxID=210632 RepID=A0A6P7JUW9_9TELE|nr:uncharacterized protein LOC114448079 [Parambassis ranga]
MNLVTDRTLHPHLRDEEAVVVENAIRLAIDSIVNVLYGVNSARTREYQRMVADRDKEIQRLEGRLTEIEGELRALRRQGCTCGLFGAERSLDRSRSSADRQTGEQSGFDAGCSDAETPTGQQECEMSLSLGLFARPPSHVSSQSHESALLSSPSRLGLDQTGTSHSSEASGVTEAARNMAPSPSSLVVKEEPCDVDAVLIKWEMCEDRLMERQESAASPSQDQQSPCGTKSLEKTDSETLREEPEADPGGFQGDHLKNKKKSVPMSELPEEVQRLKRAAWRAASRRYYARKIARRQQNPAPSGPFPHLRDSPYSQSHSYLDRRRKTLISELPVDSQMLQREAWRAASRRYYARKMARHQTEAVQYGHLLDSMDLSGDTQGASRDGANSGGIMCS